MAISRHPSVCCLSGGSWWLLPRLVLHSWCLSLVCEKCWLSQLQAIWAVASCKMELTPALFSSCSHHVLPPRQPAVQHYLGVLHRGGVPDHGRVQYVSAAGPGNSGLWGHDFAAVLLPLRPAHGAQGLAWKQEESLARAGRDTDHAGPAGAWVPGAGLRLTGLVPRDRTRPMGFLRLQAPRSCRLPAPAAVLE